MTRRAQPAWKLATPALLLALGIGAGLLQVCRELNPFDEAIILVGAERLRHGELPFRDFYALYPPGQYYVVAALLETFGRSALTMRVYCVVVRAVIAFLLYLLARRAVSAPWALAGWGACVLWLGGFGYYGYPVFPAMALALLALVLLGTSVRRARAGTGAIGPPAWGAGAALGVGALFRHDLAAYAFIACTPWMAALASPRWITGASAGTSAPGAAAVSRRALWSFFAAMVLAFGVPAAWLLSVVPVREVIFELFTYPAKIYPLVRGTPYPQLIPHAITADVITDPQRLLISLVNLPAYTPLLFNALGFLTWAVRIRAGGRRAIVDGGNLALLSLVVFGALAFNLARIRADAVHGVTMLIPSCAVAAMVLGGVWRRRSAWRLPAAVAISAIGLASIVVPLARFADSAGAFVSGTPYRGSGTQCRDAGAERETAAAYVRSIVPPGGRIFVGCGRHDVIFASEPILYFLADRLPGSRYHALDPGSANTRPIQRDIIASLDRQGVDVVLLSTLFDANREPNQSAISSGVRDLDEHLRANYALDRRFGPHLSVWRRRAGGPARAHEPASRP